MCLANDIDSIKPRSTQVLIYLIINVKVCDENSWFQLDLIVRIEKRVYRKPRLQMMIKGNHLSKGESRKHGGHMA